MKPYRSSHHRSASLALSAAIIVWAVTLAPLSHADQFIGPISEETANHRGPCGVDQAITGMQCTGSYCDNLYIYCADSPGLIDNSAPAFFGGWVTAVWQGYSDCGVDGVAVGVECFGSYCSWLRLVCKPLLRRFDGHGNYTCSTGLQYFSDEEPFCSFNGSYLQELGCNGDYCDNVFPITANYLPSRGTP